jgi:hypothetical protein
MKLAAGCASPRSLRHRTDHRMPSTQQRKAYTGAVVRLRLKIHCLQYTVVRLSYRCLHEARRRMCITAVIVSYIRYMYVCTPCIHKIYICMIREMCMCIRMRIWMQKNAPNCFRCHSTISSSVYWESLHAKRLADVSCTGQSRPGGFAPFTAKLREHEAPKPLSLLCTCLTKLSSVTLCNS